MEITTKLTVWGEEFFVFVSTTAGSWRVEIEGKGIYSEMSSPTQPTDADIASHIEGVLEMNASLQQELRDSRLLNG